MTTFSTPVKSVSDDCTLHSDEYSSVKPGPILVTDPVVATMGQPIIISDDSDDASSVGGSCCGHDMNDLPPLPDLDFEDSDTDTDG